MAVLDQGLFAGSHFVLNILLARWLPPAEYGAFAAAYSIFLLVAAFHHALLAEPMMVFGAGKFAGRFSGYLRRLLRVHAVFVLPFGLIALGGTAWWIRAGGHPLAGALVGLAASGLFILLLTMLRRALFTRMLPGWSALGGAFYAVVLLGTTLLLARSDLLSPLSALLAMGGAAGLTGLLLLLRVRSGADPTTPGPDIGDILGEHWQYGRWALASVIPMWVYGNVYYLLLPLWVGLEGAGEFRAVINLAMPVLHTFTALSLLLLPVLVRTRDEGGMEKLGGVVGKVLLLFLLGATAYLQLLVPFGDAAVLFLYSGQYQEYGVLVMLVVGLIPLAWAPISVFAGALRATERPDLVFVSQAAAAGMAIAAGSLLIWGAGVEGALVAMFLAAMVGGMVMFGCYRRLVGAHRQGGVPS